MSIISCFTGLDVNDIDFLNQYNEIYGNKLDFKNLSYLANEKRLISFDYDILAKRFLLQHIYENAHVGGFKQHMIDNFKEINEDLLVECEKMLDYENDNLFDYVGLSTLLNNRYIDLGDMPQWLYLRCAIQCRDTENNLSKIQCCYNDLSLHLYTHATPTLLNSLKKTNQLISCFLLAPRDNIEDIMSLARDCAIISKIGGGIGIHYGNIRSRGQYIKGTGGISSGVVPQIKIFNEVAATWDQGGRRKGAFCIYLDVWHADILDFLEMKLPNGNDSARARNLFYAVWIDNVFMKILEKQENYYLFSPDVATKLQLLVGKEFETEYYRLVDLKLYTQSVNSLQIANAIYRSQSETGGPFVLFKDSCNLKSNQKNIGTITGSNLCTEILEVCNKDSYACCTLASINLPKFISNGKFDFDKLGNLTKRIVERLDNLITANFYPTIECKTNNDNYRPLGIGIQGLAETLIDLNLPFISPESAIVDCKIMSTIYQNALIESANLGLIRGNYNGFEGSPISKGILQSDMWSQQNHPGDFTNLNSIKSFVSQAQRNSLLIALMPTASTSILFNNSESFEPISDLITTRTLISGKILHINKRLQLELTKLNLWNQTLIDYIIEKETLVGLEIPTEIKEKYRTVWEIKQGDILQRAAWRGSFVCQSQSLNIHLRKANYSSLHTNLMRSWKLGLKTGNYYIRTKPASKATGNIKKSEICYRENDCTSCAS